MQIEGDMKFIDCDSLSEMASEMRKACYHTNAVFKYAIALTDETR